MQPTAEPAAVVMSVIQTDYDQLQELDNTELKLSTEVTNVYVEYSNVGAGS